MIDVSNQGRILQINGSVNRGGWEMQFEIYNDSDLFDFGTLVDAKWQGGFGELPGIIRPAFHGYVVPSRIEFDATGSKTTCTAQTSDGFLRYAWCQGIGFKDQGTTARAHYHQFDSITGGGERMTMGRIVRHLLGYCDELGTPPATNPHWVAHTNLVYHETENPHGWISLDDVMMQPFDVVSNPDGSMRVNAYIVEETDNLWQRLCEIAENEYFFIYFDKTDGLHYNRHPMYDTVLPTPVMTFDSNFCVGKPIIELHDPKQLRQVRLHAVTDAGATMHSYYPESPTYVYGNVLEISRIRCNDEDTLDRWAETRYKFENRGYTVRWKAPGLCGLLFELMDRVQITYSGTSANGVHVDWTAKKFWIHEIVVTPETGHTGVSEFVLEAENS